MNYNDATYDTGDHIRLGSGRAGIVLALLILLAALFNACQDQPVDNTGISVIRDTVVNVRYDTVIVNDTDTVIVRMTDTLFIEKRDTIFMPEVRWDTVIVRDTVRDTIRQTRVDTVRVIDTIEVPRNVDRYRKATLVFHGRHDSLGLNSPLVKVGADITESLQYKIVDSAGSVIALGMSMSAAVPAQYRQFGVASLQTSVPFYLRGLTLNIPLFRMGAALGGADTIPLNRHPHNLLPVQEWGGGMMISAQAGELAAFLQGWTGQVIEVDGLPGGQRYQSWGRLQLNRINQNDRVLFGQIHGVIFVVAEINGRPVVERFEITLDLELGY